MRQQKNAIEAIMDDGPQVRANDLNVPLVMIIHHHARNEKRLTDRQKISAVC